MKILILTYAFPPLNRVASSRPYSWAKYWSKLGHEVVVLTKLKTGADGALNYGYKMEDLRGVKIIELKGWPFRLKRPASEAMSQRRKKIPVLTRLGEYMEALRVTRYGSFWGFPVIKRLRKLYKEFPYEIAVSTFGPPGGHIIASYLKKKFNVFWVADYRDLWHGNHYSLPRWPQSYFNDRLERMFVSKADLITTVSEGLKNKLSRRFDCEVVTVENGFEEEDFPKLNRQGRLFPDDGKLRIAYTGTIYKGWQDPEPLFEALNLLINKGYPAASKIEVLFFGSRLGNLAELIIKYRLEEVVKIAGFVSRSESLRVQKNVDALLFLDWGGPSDEGILTGKLYEYLYSGKPILSIGGDNTESKKLIESCNAGIALGRSPQRIADTIEKLLNGSRIDSGRSDDSLKRYSRKHLAGEMLDVIRDRMMHSKGCVVLAKQDQAIH